MVVVFVEWVGIVYVVVLVCDLVSEIIFVDCFELVELVDFCSYMFYGLIDVVWCVERFVFFFDVDCL